MILMPRLMRTLEKVFRLITLVPVHLNIPDIISQLSSNSDENAYFNHLSHANYLERNL